MKDRFNQQHAIITGGSSGIGKAVAKLLVQEGASVSIIARNEEKLHQAQAELDVLKINSQQSILALPADVAEEEENTQAIENAIAKLGNPSLLINSAGMAIPGYFMEIPIEMFNRTMEVNYFGTLYAIRAVLPAMERAERGNIVLISSGAGLIGLYGYSAYVRLV